LDNKLDNGMRKTIIVFGCIFSTSLFADIPDKTFLIGLSAGPTFVSGNETQTLNLQPDIRKTYTADNTNTIFDFPSIELFMGWQKPLRNQSLLGQLGIVLAGAGNAKLQGDVWEDADPNFNNFNYNYKVQHAHIAIQGRLTGNVGLSFEPYISASAGLGFNRAFDFKISPNISEEVAAPPFKSNTTTAFVYTLGIGIQKTLNSHFQAAIGYEFADWGNVSLSRAAGQTIGHGLSLNHLYANQIQFSVFYI
jgi:opacity protein-like surface antigen